jgi:hypothetical protein
MPSDLQVTNIKANDGTAGLAIADSTGNVSLSGSLSATSSIIRPAFLVQGSSQTLSVDSDILLNYDTVIKNLGGGSFSSNTYTAPVSGLYQINALAYFSNFPNNIDSLGLRIVADNRTIQTVWSKTLNQGHTTNYTIGFRMSGVVDIDLNETVKIVCAQNGGSTAASLSATNSYFSGFLVCNY